MLGFDSATPHSRPWGLVCIRLHGVDVDQNAWVIALVSPWQRNQRAGRAIPAASNLNLRASKVELRLVGLHCHVKGNLLNSEEVLAIRRPGRDGDIGRCVRV